MPLHSTPCTCHQPILRLEHAACDNARLPATCSTSSPPASGIVMTGFGPEIATSINRNNNRHAFNGHSNRWPPLSLPCRFGYCRPLLRGKYRQYPPKRLVELLMLLYVITLAAAENWANSNRFADDERGIRIFSNDCSILDIKNKIVT